MYSLLNKNMKKMWQCVPAPLHPLGGGCPRWQLSWMAITLVAVVRVAVIRIPGIQHQRYRSQEKHTTGNDWTNDRTSRQ